MIERQLSGDYSDDQGSHTREGLAFASLCD